MVGTDSQDGGGAYDQRVAGEDHSCVVFCGHQELRAVGHRGVGLLLDTTTGVTGSFPRPFVTDRGSVLVSPSGFRGNARRRGRSSAVGAGPGPPSGSASIERV